MAMLVYQRVKTNQPLKRHPLFSGAIHFSKPLKPRKKPGENGAAPNPSFEFNGRSNPTKLSCVSLPDFSNPTVVITSGFFHPMGRTTTLSYIHGKNPKQENNLGGLLSNFAKRTNVMVSEKKKLQTKKKLSYTYQIHKSSFLP